MAEELEAALRANPDALLEHFVRTATAIEVKKVAGGVWAEADNDQVSALREAVQLRLAVGNLSYPLGGIAAMSANAGPRIAGDGAEL